MIGTYTYRERARVGSSNQNLGIPTGMWFLIGTGVIWGTIGVGSRAVLDHSAIDPVMLTWIRSAIAAPLCILAIWFSGGRRLVRFSRHDVAVMIASGFILVFYQWSYLFGVEQIGVTTPTLIALCGSPVIVAILSVLLLHEKLSHPQLLAMGGALIGAILVIGRPTELDGGNGVLGVLGAFGCATGMAIHAMGSRKIAARVHPMVVLSFGFSVGAIVLTPVVLQRGLHPDASSLLWILVLYLAVGPSFFAYFFFQRGLREVPASMATIVTLIEPVMAAVLAWFFFGEQLGLSGLIGGGLLLGSIWVLSTRAMKREPNPVQLVVETEG